jgi:CBS domain-containing protein
LTGDGAHNRWRDLRDELRHLRYEPGRELPYSAYTRALVRTLTATCWSRGASSRGGTESEPRRAADVVAPYPFTYLRPTTPLREALEQLLAGGESALPVKEAGMVVGTIALVDLVEATRDGTGDQPVSTVMRKPVFTRATTPIDEVRDLLIQDSAGMITVVDDNGTVAGHITPVTALAGHTSTPPRSTQRSSSGLITAGPEDLLLSAG